MRDKRHERRKRFCFVCGKYFASEIVWLTHKCKTLPALPPVPE